MVRAMMRLLACVHVGLVALTAADVKGHDGGVVELYVDVDAPIATVDP
jgi:hypothetical protein